MILVGVPMRDETPSQWHLHWLQMGWMPRGAVLLPRVGTLVHESRNRIVEEALGIQGWKTLVMLDADVFPPPHEECPHDALEFIAEYEAEDVPVVGPLCYGRSMVHPTPVAGHFASDSTYCRLSDQQHDGLEADPGLHPVDVLGMGMVCIRRDVFEALEPPWFHHPVVDGRVLGEDHQFYRRVKQAGIPVRLDTRWHALHLGQLFYGKRTYRMWRAGHEAGERDPGTAEAAAPR
jgi:hypothetical protein